MKITKKTKIIIGVGVLALAYWLYMKNKSKKLANQQTSTPTSSTTPSTTSSTTTQTTTQTPITPTPTTTPIIPSPSIPNQQTPLPNFPEGYRLQITENFTAEYFNPSTGNNKIATFTKNQIVNAKTVQTPNGGAFATTPEGKYPSNAIGTLFVVLPQNKINSI